MKYVIFDPATGSLTGYFDQELQPEHAEHAIEAPTECTASRWNEFRANTARDGIELVPLVESVAVNTQQLIDDVDRHIAAIYARWTRFQIAYVAREAAAREFVAAGYAGDPGPWVTKFAEPAQLTLRDAADRILAQADGLRVALEQLDAQRMRKYEIIRATAPNAALEAYRSIIHAADEIAAGLQ